MTVHYSTAVAQARLQAVIDALDAVSNPLLVVGTSALAGGTAGVLFTITLNTGPCATISGRTLTFSGTPIDDTATAAGAAAKAELRASDGTVVVDQLSVGVTGSGANIIMDTTGVVIGRPVRLVSASIVHP